MQSTDTGAQPASRTGPRWVYSVLPVSLATGPLGALIQLYLVNLNGQTLGTIYASLAVAMFNGVSIPAAVFWGYATDRWHARKSLIAASYSAMALTLFPLSIESSTTGIIAIYSLFAFISAASATPLNLLIMETEHKSRWASTFARLSMMSSVGNVCGLILSYFWTALVYPLSLLAYPLGAFSLASAVLAVTTIKEPVAVLERETIVMRKPSFFSRLLSLPLMFLILPRPSDFKRVFRGLRFTLSSYLPLFYISIVCFYLSSGLFNASFVPALSSFSFSDSEVFGIILVGVLVQTLAFQFVGRRISRRSLTWTSIQGLLLRGGCYGILGIVIAALPARSYLVPILIFYPLAAGVAFAVYYTSSNTMIFNTVQNRSPGSALGVYSAVVGTATLAGSLVSGFVSVYFGFQSTFMAAALLLILGAVFLSRIPHTSSLDSPD